MKKTFIKSNNKISKLSRIGVCASVIGVPQVALAEVENESAKKSDRLEEVVVTARRRSESLLDVPLSVSAVSGVQLEKIGAPDITALNETMPNVTLEVSRATNSTLSAFIRGVGQQDPVAGFEAGVGIYIDDVYLNRPQAAALDIFDVERIEVLRGPQGTLYGRNTIGGAVKYVTRRLDASDPTLNVRLNAGNYGQFDQIITGSTPLSDTLRIGGSVANFHRDGYGRNLITGEDNYNKKLFGFRGSVEWEPTDDLFFRVSYDQVNDDSNPRHGHRLIPGLLSGAPVLDNVFDTRAGLNVPVQSVKASGWSLLSEWQLNDTWTLKNTASNRDDDSASPIDFDSLPAADLDVPIIYRNKQFSDELQLAYNSDRLNGVIGAYYLDAEAFNVFDALLDTAFAGFNAQTLGDVNTKTWSIFANFTYDVSDQLGVTLGGRYTDDKRNARILRRSFLGGLSDTFGGTGFVFATTSDFDGANSFTNFSPTLSVSYKPDGDNNLYFTYSQGFKGGGFDPRGQSSATPDFDGSGTVTDDEIFSFLAFEPEQVDSYEIGWKYSGDSYRHSLAVFFADYTDIQVPGSIGVDTDGDGTADTFAGVTTNAGAADIYGIEYEGLLNLASDQATAGDGLDVNWSIGYLHGEYNEFIDAFGVDISDTVEIQNTPDITASATLTYSRPVADGQLSILSTLSHRGGSRQFEFESPIDQSGGFSLWNTSVVWDGDDDKWQFGLHGRNLTNKEYIVAGYDLFTNGSPLGLEGTLTAFYGAPRTYTATVSRKF